MCDLRDSSGSRWKSAGSVVTSLGGRSVRLVDGIVRIVVRTFRLLNIVWEGVGIVEDFRLAFPKIKVLPPFQLSSEFLPSFHLVTKSGIHDLSSRDKQHHPPTDQRV